MKDQVPTSSSSTNYDEFISYDHDYFEKSANSIELTASPMHTPTDSSKSIEKGIYQFDDGYYEGPIINMLPHGHGVTRFNDGSTYVGFYCNGLRDDEQGELYYPNGRLVRK
jgi:hypothetical protein